MKKYFTSSSAGKHSLMTPLQPFSNATLATTQNPFRNCLATLYRCGEDLRTAHIFYRKKV